MVTIEITLTSSERVTLWHAIYQAIYSTQNDIESYDNDEKTQEFLAEQLTTLNLLLDKFQLDYLDKPLNLIQR